MAAAGWLLSVDRTIRSICNILDLPSSISAAARRSMRCRHFAPLVHPLVFLADIGCLSGRAGEIRPLELAAGLK